MSVHSTESLFEVPPSAFVGARANCSKAVERTDMLLQMISHLRDDLATLESGVEGEECAKILLKYNQTDLRDCTHFVQGMLAQYIDIVEDVFKLNQEAMESAARIKEHATFASREHPPKISLDQRKTELEGTIELVRQRQEWLRTIASPPEQLPEPIAQPPQQMPSAPESTGSRAHHMYTLGRLAAAIGPMATWGITKLAPLTAQAAALGLGSIWESALYWTTAMALPVAGSAIAFRETSSWDRGQWVAATVGGAAAFGISAATSIVAPPLAVGVGALAAGKVWRGASTLLSRMVQPKFQEDVQERMMDVGQATAGEPSDVTMSVESTSRQVLRPKLRPLSARKFSRIVRRFKSRDPGKTKQLDMDQLLKARLGKVAKKSFGKWPSAR